MTSTQARPALLFICNHNAGRSVLAAALARHRAGDRVEVFSAGVEPADLPNPVTIASLAELDIDDSSHIPSKVTEELVSRCDVVVAMKASLHIPLVDGVTYETWDVPNPAGWDTVGIRPLRDHIDNRVADLLTRMLDQ